ncbi:hypothetical protein TIFTF001_003348 [Ficus carica]|uniref:Uncharacterized protein n=1 Tax=Ficus carica TaxID=3494 RepID=A0AA88CU06_FICCA|nr:hypothetical protein TIFTF001_003348 [Ficus carica]
MELDRIQNLQGTIGHALRSPAGRDGKLCLAHALHALVLVLMSYHVSADIWIPTRHFWLLTLPRRLPARPDQTPLSLRSFGGE